ARLTLELADVANPFGPGDQRDGLGFGGLVIVVQPLRIARMAHQRDQLAFAFDPQLFAEHRHAGNPFAGPLVGLEHLRDGNDVLADFALAGIAGTVHTDALRQWPFVVAIAR